MSHKGTATSSKSKFRLSKIKKILIGILIAIALFIALVFANAYVKLHYLSPKPNSYLTTKVVRGDIQSTVMTTGSLQANQQVDVGARVSGQLKSLKVHLGDHVESGQLLAEIDPVLSQNALLSAHANLESLAAQRRAVAASVLQSMLAYKRQNEMIAQDATSRQEVESAKAQLQMQRANLASFDAQISQAKTQVDTAVANLDYSKITAPMSGEVVAIVTQEGQTVVASQQAPVILKLANLDVMTVKALISEADVIHINQGQTSYFTILGDAAERHFGTVGTIEPAPQDFSENGTKASGPVFYNALFDTPNTDHHLRIGMTAQVTVVLKEAKNVLIVSLSALGKQAADGRYPLRILNKDGRVTTVLAGIGINDTVRAQVMDGLKEGDEIITEDSASKENAAGTN
jgi:membrane fusion protein, macrolide-specific efflux system